MNNIIVLDVETGGRDEKQNPITQLALQVIDGVNFHIMHSYEAFVKPYNNLKIEKQALDYTQVSLKDIEQKGVEINTLLKEVMAAVKVANKSGKGGSKPIIVGHNVAFDIKFLKYLFEFKNKDLFEYFDETAFDTLKLCKLYEAGKLRGPEVKYTLGACCERFGLKHKSAHGAGADVEVTKQLFIKLCNIFRSTEKGINGHDTNGKAVKSRQSFFFQI